MKAEQYLRDETDFEEIQVIDRLEGEHNQSMIFNSDRGKFVLRKVKENHPEGGGLENERNILEFLNEKKIDFAPESVLYDEDEEIHIISYEGMEDSDFTKLEDSELEDLAGKLARLHELEFDEYVEFCEEKGLEAGKPEEYADRIEYIRENVDALSYSDEMTAWIRENLDELEEELPEKSSEETGIRHADLPGSIRTGEKGVSLIDWEFSVFSHHPAMDIADLYVDEEVPEQKFERFREIYLKERELESIKSEMDVGARIRLLLNTSWALRRAEAAENQEKSDDYLSFAERQRQKFSESTG